MKNDNLYLIALKYVVLIVMGMLVCRITRGYALFPLVGVACYYAVTGKVSKAWCIFIFIQFTMNINSVLIPKSGIAWAVGSRGGIVAISLAFIVGNVNRKGWFRLPFNGMMLFLLAALFSLYDSWVPQISLLKIILFSLFFFGICAGAREFQRDMVALSQMRAFFFAIALILIVGSLALYPFPHISFATSFRHVMSEGATAAEVAILFEQMSGKTLFCGITGHSQTLAPFLAIAFAWLLCDTLFVEGQFRWLHSLLLLLTLPMLYMTRSRVAFFTFVSAIVIIYFYTRRKIGLNPMLLKHLNKVMIGLGVLLVIGGAIVEIRSGVITRWLRKTDDIKGDTRSLSEALTSSRQSAIEMCMMEFKRNPVVGSGFQVAWYSRDKYAAAGGGFVISSSIEKGILPIMVLGETGVVGASAFLLALMCFFIKSAKRGYYITITLFSVLLATNMGEATFFSPSGCGGLFWLVAVVGGFAMDTVIICRNESEADPYRIPAPYPVPYMAR